MTESQEGMIVHKAEMLEMDFLRGLGIEPNFADVSKHIEKLLSPMLDVAEDESELEDLRNDNEELDSKCEELEGTIYSIENYAAKMRRELNKMDFEGKSEIEAILSDIESEL